MLLKVSHLKLFVLYAILSVCYCDSTKKKKHKYELYWHGFHYLTFLILKFKAILVFGTIFTIGLLVGKFFAIIKLAEYMKKSRTGNLLHESFYDHSPLHGISSDTSGYGKISYFDNLPPRFTGDQLLTKAHIFDTDNHYEQTHRSGGKRSYSHERSSNIKNNIYHYFNWFQQIMSG